MTRMRVSIPALLAACVRVVSACSQPAGVRDAVILGEDPAPKLSDYGLFSDVSARKPAEGVVPYDLVNAHVAYAFGPNERFRIRLWGRNLTHQAYYIYGVANALGRSGSAASPRTYGAEFGFRF